MQFCCTRSIHSTIFVGPSFERPVINVTERIIGVQLSTKVSLTKNSSLQVHTHWVTNTLDRNLSLQIHTQWVITRKTQNGYEYRCKNGQQVSRTGIVTYHTIVSCFVHPFWWPYLCLFYVWGAGTLGCQKFWVVVKFQYCKVN